MNSSWRAQDSDENETDRPRPSGGSSFDNRRNDNRRPAGGGSGGGGGSFGDDRRGQNRDYGGSNRD